MKTLASIFSILRLVLSAESGPGAAVSAVMITNRPLSQAVYQGGAVTFTVGASSTNRLSYQWTLNGAILSGATNPSLTINNLQPTNAVDYAVIVSDLTGVAYSSPAILAVLTNLVSPSITQQPNCGPRRHCNLHRGGVRHSPALLSVEFQ